MGAIAVIVAHTGSHGNGNKTADDKQPHHCNGDGIMESPRLTVLSTPPAAFMEPEKAPAARKIRHMVTIFSSPMPFEIIATFS